MHPRHARLAVAALAVAAAPFAALTSAGAAGRPLQAIVTAHKPVVLANGTATSTVTVRLFHGWRHAHGQAVTLTTTAVPSGGSSCGTLAATSGTTGPMGAFRTTYTASSSVGFCQVTATSGSASASATIDQIDPTLAAANTRYDLDAKASAHVLKADGTSTSTITFTVTNGTTPVAGDAIDVAALPLAWRGTCGTISLAAPVTDSNGQLTATYTASTARGFCLLRGWEAATAAHSHWIVIRQVGTRH